MIAITLQDDAWTDVEEGTGALLEEWLVEPGERVSEGQSLAIVSIEKASFEVAAPQAGTVARLLLKPQDKVERGQVLAEIEAAPSPP